MFLAIPVRNQEQGESYVAFVKKCWRYGFVFSWLITVVVILKEGMSLESLFFGLLLAFLFSPIIGLFLIIMRAIVAAFLNRYVRVRN